MAAATLAGVAAAFVFLPGGSAAQRPSPSHYTVSVTSAASGLAEDQVTSYYHHLVTANVVRQSARAAHRKYLAKLAARRARQRAAQQAAAQASAQPTPTPSQTASPAATVSSGGGNAASSALGVCIRNSEEGGSYAWGPGNGGGAYQFQLSTWEKYGGAASQYGVAGPAYQDQIFNNAIAAGGASNWTAYDGC
jgi:hypothetical protein